MDTAIDQLMQHLWGTWDVIDLGQKLQALFPDIPASAAEGAAQQLAELHVGGSYDKSDVDAIVRAARGVCPPCPWCRHPITLKAKDGGSLCCFQCDPAGHSFHECPRNPNAKVAGDGRSYAVGHPGPAMCRHCRPTIADCHCPWCDAPILDASDDGSSICDHCPGGRMYHKCPGHPAAVTAPNGQRYALGAPGPDSCPHCIDQ